MTDSGLSTLKSLSALERLTLSFCLQVKGTGFYALSGLASLTYLEIMNYGERSTLLLTSEGARALGSLCKLKILFLGGEIIHAEDLFSLTNLTALRTLRWTSRSEQIDLQALKRALKTDLHIKD